MPPPTAVSGRMNAHTENGVADGSAITTLNEVNDTTSAGARNLRLTKAVLAGSRRHTAYLR